MTKDKALNLLIGYVSVHGVPVNDVVVWQDKSGPPTEWVQWTFKGLKKFILSK